MQLGKVLRLRKAGAREPGHTSTAAACSVQLLQDLTLKASSTANHQLQEQARIAHDAAAVEADTALKAARTAVHPAAAEAASVASTAVGPEEAFATAIAVLEAQVWEPVIPRWKQLGELLQCRSCRNVYRSESLLIAKGVAKGVGRTLQIAAAAHPADYEAVADVDSTASASVIYRSKHSCHSCH